MLNLRQTPLRLLMLAGVLLLTAGCPDNAGQTTNPVQSMNSDQFIQHISSDSFKGLVVVFASWCLPCREELPEVADIYRNLSAEGIQIIAASVDDGKTEKVQRLVNRLKLPFPVYHVGSELVPKLRIVGVPTLLKIDKGVILENSPGQRSSMELATMIKSLSAATP